LNGNIRRRFAEAESLPSTITKWQERAVKLDHNIRQSRAEERVLGGKAAAWVPLGPNAQHQREQKSPWGQSSRGGFNAVRGSGFRPQWNSGGFRSIGFQGDQNQGDGRARDPNAMDVGRGRSWGGEDQRYFNYGVFGHIVRNCRNPKGIRKGTQEKSKEDGDQ